MAFEDEINYEKIRKINEKEKKSSKFSSLDPEFYPALISHLKKLQNEYNKKYLNSPTSTEALLLNNEICKLDDIIKKIYDFRERKILLSAWKTESTPDLRNMLEHEQQIYHTIVDILSGYRDKVLNQKPNPICKQPKHIEMTEKVEPTTMLDKENTSNSTAELTDNVHVGEESLSKSVPESEDNTDTLERATELQVPTTNTPTEDDPKHILVRVLEDIKPFVGTDLVTYNLHKEELVTIPKQNADILDKNNKIKLVEPTI